MAQSEILQKGIHLPDVSGECETIYFQVKWYLILSPFYMEHNTINCLICSCLWSIFVPLSLSLPHLRKYGGDGGCYMAKTSEKQTRHSFSLWVGEKLGRYLLGHQYVVPNICWTKTTAGESPSTAVSLLKALITHRSFSKKYHPNRTHHVLWKFLMEFKVKLFLHRHFLTV